MNRRANTVRDNLPIDNLPNNLRMWAVFGKPSCPMIMCCKITMRGGSRKIWRHSIENGVERFDGLGEPLGDWIARQRMAYFFAAQSPALDLIADMTMPGIR